MSCFGFLSTPPVPKGDFKVCVVGGAGGIGQPLSLLMATCPLVKELAIIDLNIAVVPVEGVEKDLSHIEGKCKVTSTCLTLNQDKAIDKAGDALTGCHLVLVPAGVPRKPGQDRKDLLTINADIAKGTVEACAKFCPDAVVALIVNPVNSVVPAMAELWKKAGLNPKKIVGITTLDVVRANKFVSEMTGEPATIPVIGGHAGITIIPVISQSTPSVSFDKETTEALTARIQDAGTEVVKAKAGAGSATLSMAFAAARFADNCLTAQSGQDVIEYAYVESKVTDATYFSSKLTLGSDGIKLNHGLGELTDYEKSLVEAAVPELQKTITKGEKFVEGFELSN